MASSSLVWKLRPIYGIYIISQKGLGCFSTKKLANSSVFKPRNFGNKKNTRLEIKSNYPILDLSLTFKNLLEFEFDSLTHRSKHEHIFSFDEI